MTEDKMREWRKSDEWRHNDRMEDIMKEWVQDELMMI